MNGVALIVGSLAADGSMRIGDGGRLRVARPPIRIERWTPSLRRSTICSSQRWQTMPNRRNPNSMTGEFR
jgi:hypothetical protein